MDIININLESIIVDNHFDDNIIDKLIEENGGIKLSNKTYSIAEEKYKEIKDIIKNKKVI